MISTHLLLIYLAALAAIYAVPGPDMALVLQTSIGRGVRRASRRPPACRCRVRCT